MPYLNTTTGEYPRFPGDLENLGWVQGTALPEGWVECEVDPLPEFADNETYVALEPAQDESGKWHQGWTTRLLTDEEIKERALLLVRRKVMRGVPLTPQEASMLVEEEA